MSMQSTPQKRKTQPGRKKRAHRRGIPAALLAASVVIALFFGGLFGFIIANKTGSCQAKLEAAQERISELENTLVMMGFSEGISNPDEFAFDDSGVADEFGDLAGEGLSNDSSALWNEDTLIGGMMEQPAEDVVVAQFKGGELLSSEVVAPYNDRLATSAFGFGDAVEDSGAVMQEVMQNLVADKICYLKAQEMGLTELTDADREAIRAEAEAGFNAQKEFYRDTVDVSGLSAEEADAELTRYLEQDVGITLDGMIAEETDRYWMVKLFNEVTKEVTVSDEEVQAAYDALLADQSARFAESAEDYEFSVFNGETIASNPEGYRRVKHILLGFGDIAAEGQAEALYEQIAALGSSPTLEEVTPLQEQLDALYTELDAQAQSIIEELNGGADFDALVEKYGTDPAMLYEPAKSQGYCVSAESHMFPAEFITGSMMLERPGDVSEPVHTVDGVHIIKYVEDVTPGAVPLEEIRPVLAQEVLTEKQEKLYLEQSTLWMTEAEPTYYPERMQ